MRFWDASAVVPLVVDEPTTDLLTAALREDPRIAVAWFTSVEVTSAICRRQREEKDDERTARSEGLLRELSAKWLEATNLQAIAHRARELLARHTLKAADALQLASALVIAGDESEFLPFITLDHRLATAARAEGLTVIEPQSNQ